MLETFRGKFSLECSSETFFSFNEEKESLFRARARVLHGLAFVAKLFRIISDIIIFFTVLGYLREHLIDLHWFK